MRIGTEQAGGADTTGERIFEVSPGELHQRMPVILGSRNEVERVADYHS